MNKTFLGIILLVAGFSMFTSCIQENYYNTEPTTGTTPTTSQYVFSEQFNGADNYGWSFTSSSDSAYASIYNGYYEYVNYGYTYSSITTVGTGADTRYDFSAEARIRSNNTMGLVFGASGSDYGYVLYLDEAGYYSLYREGYGSIGSTELIPFTRATPYAVVNGWNTIEIEQIGNRWKGYINGSQMFSIPAHTLAGNKFGFKVLPGTIGYADYLKVTSY